MKLNRQSLVEEIYKSMDKEETAYKNLIKLNAIYTVLDYLEKEGIVKFKKEGEKL